MKAKITPAIMAVLMIVFIIFTALILILNNSIKSELLRYLYVITGAVATHFIIMHLSAPIVYVVFRKRFRYNSFWFKAKSVEPKLYSKLKVKR